MNHARLFWHSLRHTRPSQLAARLRLMGKRAIKATVGALTPVTRLRLPDAPAVRDLSPKPLFPPRHKLVEQEGGRTYLRYLNLRYPLGRTPDWHPPELAVGTRLEKLNLHYMEYLEAVDDTLFQELVAHWIDNNPPYRKDYWLDSWNSYALSNRCVVWMQQYAVRRGRLANRFVQKMAASLFQQIRFLERNLELDIRGNHLIKNTKALLWASQFFTASHHSYRWHQLGRGLLRAELEQQILPDGMHEERSPAYHCQIFADILECYALLPGGENKQALGEALDAMAQVTANLTHPDGLVSLFNDGGLHMTYRPQECLDIWQKLSGMIVRSADHFALNAAGYFGLREDGNFLLVDCGPIGPDHLPAHSHGDMLAFEWDVSGQRIIVDAGTYEYHPGYWRDYARATTSHNTVSLAEEDQCEFWGAFRVGRRGRATVHELKMDRHRLVLEGSHDGYRRLSGRPIHRRQFDATPRRIVVRDLVIGGRGQPVQARLLLHPDCRVELSKNHVIIQANDVSVRLRTSSPVRQIEAWWTPDFGVRQATVQLMIDYGPCPCTGSFTLEAAA